MHESLTSWHWYVVFNCELDRKTNNWKCLLKYRIQRTQRTYRHTGTHTTLTIHYPALCATIHYPTNWMENVNLVDELLYAVARLLLRIDALYWMIIYSSMYFTFHSIGQRAHRRETPHVKWHLKLFWFNWYRFIYFFFSFLN